MVKQSKILLALSLFTVQYFIACYPCDKNVCASADNITGNFELRSADGKDLVFGADKRYDKSLIRFYSLNGNDTSFYEQGSGRYPGSLPADSFFFAKFEGFPDTAYLRLSDGDIDTLAFEYLESQNASCCVPRKDIQKIYFNGKNESIGNIAKAIK